MNSGPRRSKGRVSLVGAGPGDPGLLTIKAVDRIKSADLIIYDYLANPEHLEHAKSSSIKIALSKGFRYDRLRQQKVNRLIISASRKGQHVVRLKGGDPYLFGRGGEEALFLKKNRIYFEVVPGVTSATACAAYSGIPLTHRDHNASVTFLTGHRAEDRNLDSVDWERLVALNGTLVIYMGFYNLTKIAERLMEFGMPGNTRIAVIQWGTLPWQKSCDGTLQNISAIVSKKRLGPPAIIIIGDVVSLRDRLSWFERLPLFGKRILITRSRDKAGILKQKLRDLGAWAIELPSIEIKPVDDPAGLDRAIRRINRFDWVVFTSTYGVNAFFDRLEERHNKDARILGRVKIACVGPETKAALKAKGITADLEPRRFETSAIVEEFKKRFGKLNEIKILLLRTNIAPPALEEGLKGLGAQVTRVTAYHTVFSGPASKEAKKNVLRNPVDYMTFTSSSTASNTIKLLGLNHLKQAAKKTCFASIGPITSKTLTGAGLKPGCEAKNFTIDGLIHAIINHAKQHQ